MVSSGGQVRSSRSYPGPTAEELATLVQRVIDAGSVARAGLTETDPALLKPAPSSTRRAHGRTASEYTGPSREELGSLLEPEAALGDLTEVERALNFRRIVVRPVRTPGPARDPPSPPIEFEGPEPGPANAGDGAAPVSDRFLSQLDDIAVNLRRRTSSSRTRNRSASENPLPG